MLAKIKVKNPALLQDYNGNYSLTFPVETDSRYSVKQLMNCLQCNEKTLTLTVDYETKHRTLDQNALMWALLTEYAYGLNGGRKGGITEEELYYKALEKYGIATFLFVREDAVEQLKLSYKFVQVIDKGQIKGKTYAYCKCTIGSSVYSTKQMADLIDGILDDMADAEINTANKQELENEWRAYGRK